MAPGQVKPIETRYKGCRFRSRLEARHAVYFDALGIEWLYEPEGFQFSGGFYLPDFFFPTLGEGGVYGEVKSFAIPVGDRVRLGRFASEIGRPLIFFVGLPLDGVAESVVPAGPGLIEAMRVFRKKNNAAWLETRITIAETYGFYPTMTYLPSAAQTGIDAFLPRPFDEAHQPSQACLAAIYRAKSARFEFGEAG